MDSKILDRNYEEDPHSGVRSGQTSLVSEVTEGEDEHHHEKTSVLKKVKAKARKIKETLTKHGHGHGPDQEHDYHHDEHGHDREFDEEDDEEDEMAEDPEVHGAPMYESAAIRNTDPGHEENIGRPRGNLGGSTVMEEDHHAPMNTPVSISPGINQTKVNDMARNFDIGQEENQRQHGGNLGRSTVLEEDPHAPKDRLEEHSPANYQTKVTDPTGAGGEEAGITLILRSFGKMGVNDETEQKTEHFLHTGSHDQFSPELAPPTKITDFPQNPQTSTDPDDNKTETQPNQSTYTEKISSATSVIADKAISAKNAVTSKLGYGEKDDNATPDMQGSGETTKASQVGEYGRKIAATVTEKLAPVYDKVAEAGSTVASKMPGTGTGAVTEGGVKGPDKGVSVKEYLVEKLRPGDEDKALSEVISNALGKCKEERSNKAEMVSPRPVAEVISDAMHKRKEENEGEKVCRPMGKVTESEEVAKSLGTGDEDSGEGRVEYSGNVNPVGKGVVDRVKGVVSSWLGKGGGDQSQTSQTSLGSTYGCSSSAAGK